MAERGIEVTCETIRTWCTKFGPEYARSLRRRQPQASDKWHLDEVFIKIVGVQNSCGGQSTSTATSSTSSFNRSGTGKLRPGSFAHSSNIRVTRRGC